MRADEVNGLLKQRLMRNVFPKLCQAELHGVDEGANRVLLVPSKRFSDHWLQVGCKLIGQASHAVLDKPANRFYNAIFIHKLSHDTINEWP